MDRNHTTREREVIVTDGGRGFGGTLVAIIALLAVLVVGWFAIQAIGGGDGDAVPDSVDVNITDTGGDGGQ